MFKILMEIKRNNIRNSSTKIINNHYKPRTDGYDEERVINLQSKLVSRIRSNKGLILS